MFWISQVWMGWRSNQTESGRKSLSRAVELWEATTASRNPWTGDCHLMEGTAGEAACYAHLISYVLFLYILHCSDSETRCWAQWVFGTTLCGYSHELYKTEFHTCYGCDSHSRRASAYGLANSAEYLVRIEAESKWLSSCIHMIPFPPIWNYILPLLRLVFGLGAIWYAISQTSSPAISLLLWTISVA